MKLITLKMGGCLGANGDKFLRNNLIFYVLPPVLTKVMLGVNGRCCPVAASYEMIGQTNHAQMKLVDKKTVSSISWNHKI